MATQQQIINNIITTIEQSVEKINASVPAQQQRIFKEISLLLKDLDLRGDTIQQTAKNLRIIGKAKSKLDEIVNSDKWQKSVSEYLKSFDEITKLQNQYFATLAKDYKPNALLGEIKNQSIDATLNSLTEAGISASVTEKIQDILRLNITTGASYTQMSNQLRDFITTNETGAGALERYTKQITTDALNQYSAQYTNAVTNDLGLEWFQYTGALIETSRTFCVALIKKKYVHKSELASIIRGDFKEFEDADGKINPKTKLPEGMVAGTNVSNFHVYRGGYQCGHQLMAVAEIGVPVNIRKATYLKMNIPFDEQGFRKAA